MSIIYSGIAFINAEISPSIQEKIVNQLFIDIVLTGLEFDAIVNTDPDYANRVKKSKSRVLVIKNYAQNEITNNIINRDFADVILFVKNGLVNVVTKSGHGPTLTIENIYWAQLFNN